MTKEGNSVQIEKKVSLLRGRSIIKHSNNKNININRGKYENRMHRVIRTTYDTTGQ